MSEILHVLEVRPLGGFVLEVAFDNGVRKVVDVRPLLEGPVFEPLHDESLFSRASVDPVSRTVVWPNGADLAPEALLDLPALSAGGNDPSRDNT